MTTDSALKTVVITGASRGIGKGIVDRFATRDWRVFALSRHPSEHEDRPQVHHLALDVADPTSVFQAFEAIRRMTGGIDVAANCAGVFQKGPVEELNLEDTTALFDVNVTGTLRCMQHELPLMRSGGVAEQREEYE